jgi:hypothetical protein
MMTPEGRVKAAVKRVLREFDIWYFCPVSNGMGQAGIPDFICCWDGRFLAIETKAPGKTGNTTANQDRVIECINAAGGRALVIDNAEILRAFLVQHRACV